MTYGIVTEVMAELKVIARPVPLYPLNMLSLNMLSHIVVLTVTWWMSSGSMESGNQ